MSDSDNDGIPTLSGVGMPEKKELVLQSFWDDMIVGPKQPKRMVAFELTLNFPHTQAWLNATVMKQRGLYERLLKYIQETWGPYNCLWCERAFEFTKKGQVHLHALLYYTVEPYYTDVGLINDIVRTFLRELPRKYSRFKEEYVYPDLKRYKSPSICLQYRDPYEDTGKLAEWLKYIYKDQKDGHAPIPPPPLPDPKDLINI